VIDALEVVIALLRSDQITSDLAGGRIANKHRYGDDGTDQRWPMGQPAITVRQDGGGAPDLYVPVVKVGLEIRCYGGSQNEAMQIWLRLCDLARLSCRVVVQTANGQALLYYLVARNAATQIVDEEIGMDAAVGLFEAMVYREALAA